MSKQYRVALVLAAATLVPISALGWLGARTVQQERAIERQEQRERLELAATRLALDLDRRLQTVERDLSAGHGIRLTIAGVKDDGGSILFQPSAPASPPVSSRDLSNAEVVEFQRHDLTAAADAYRRRNVPQLRRARWRHFSRCFEASKFRKDFVRQSLEGIRSSHDPTVGHYGVRESLSGQSREAKGG
jgi:hypothetical protein